MKVRLATCAVLPELDADAAPLAAALDRAGVEHELIAWDDPSADWDAHIATLIRSTWNYALDLERYLAWIDRIDRIAGATLWNPAAIIRSNVHKRYLLALAARGVPVIPTTVIERGGTLVVPAEARIVIKPEVGAGSLNARIFAAGDPAAIAHCAAITARGAALVQPYIASVEDYGERSLIWIDGELTHAIRKSPRLSGDRESTTGPMPIADDERAVALAALAPIADQILYARCDLVRGATGEPMIMELELVEPSLFFSKFPPAADRLVAGLIRRL